MYQILFVQSDCYQEINHDWLYSLKISKSQLVQIILHRLEKIMCMFVSMDTMCPSRYIICTKCMLYWISLIYLYFCILAYHLLTVGFIQTFLSQIQKCFPYKIYMFGLSKDIQCFLSQIFKFWMVWRSVRRT